MEIKLDSNGTTIGPVSVAKPEKKDRGRKGQATVC